MKILIIFFLFFVTNGQNIFYNYTQFINQSIERLGFLDINSNLVTFRLWTRNLHTPIQIETGKLLNISQIKRDKIFKIITHGYMNTGNASWMMKIKDEYLKKDDYNVILVDWGKAAGVMYPFSARYSKCVGKYLGQLVYDLNRTLGINLNNVHLVGHSLGAHVSGFAGKYVQIFGLNIARITGLDPAGPLFFLASDTNRLSKSDATFVDVIHTDSLKYGYILPLGDIDFYPNGGISPQPGCNPFNIVQELYDGCSHTRSIELFTESISLNNLIATSCANFILYITRLCRFNPTAVMGENVNKNMTGIFQLTANSASPFGRNGVI